MLRNLKRKFIPIAQNIPPKIATGSNSGKVENPYIKKPNVNMPIDIQNCTKKPE